MFQKIPHLLYSISMTGKDCRKKNKKIVNYFTQNGETEAKKTSMKEFQDVTM